MPVYNAEKYLGTAIESILNQTFRDFEFIIINDGSTDSSADIIRSYHDQRILLIENPINVGITSTMNRGLSMGRGEYIARMDADDISMPTRLEKQLDFLIHNKNIGVVGSAIRIIDHNGKPHHTSSFPQEDSLIRWTMCFSNPMANGSLMMRSENILRVGGYQSSAAEDYNLLEKLNWVTAFSNLPDVLFYLRRSEKHVSYTSRNRAAVISDSVRISHRRIEKILGEEVPITLIEMFWGVPLQKSGDALRMTKLIFRLAAAITADVRLTPRERQNIKNDAARRILKIQTRLNITARHRWQVYQFAHQLDPYGLARVFMRRIGRAIRNLYFSTL